MFLAQFTPDAVTADDAEIALSHNPYDDSIMSAATVLTDQFDRALLYATHVHGGQVRYIEHLKTVDRKTRLVSLSDKVHNARSFATCANQK
jgi:predicted MPP superfamily phosphohydrolase